MPDIFPAPAVRLPTPPSVTLKTDANAIAFALARNECGEKLPLKELLAAMGLAPTPALRAMLTSTLFKHQYAAYVQELRTSGESFKLKTRVMAEELLKTHWAIIHDHTTPASVRMQGIESVVEWADLKPRKGPEVPAPAAISINIDLSNGGKPEVITVVTTEQAELEQKK